MFSAFLYLLGCLLEAPLLVPLKLLLEAGCSAEGEGGPGGRRAGGGGDGSLPGPHHDHRAQALPRAVDLWTLLHEAEILGLILAHRHPHLLLTTKPLL